MQTKEKELHPPVVQNKCYFSQAEVKFSLLRGVISMSKISQKPFSWEISLELSAYPLGQALLKPDCQHLWSSCHKGERVASPDPH